MALVDDFKKDPDAIRVPLVTIEATRVHEYLDDGVWTSDGNRFIVEWRWTPKQVPFQVREIKDDGTSEVTLTVATSVANCDATNGSWFYEVLNDGELGKVHINPTTTITGFFYAIDYKWRLTSKAGRIYQVSGEWTHWVADIIRKPETKRFVNVLQSVFRSSTGSFTVHSDDITERVSRDIIYNRPILIEIIGSTKGQELPFSDRIQDFQGKTVSSGDKGGKLQVNPLTKGLTIPYSDDHELNDVVLPTNVATPFSGNSSTILNAAFTEAGLTVPTVEAGFDAARPYILRISRPNPQTLFRIIQAVTGHLSIFFYQRDGTPFLTWWRPSTGASPKATFRERNDPIYPRLVMTLDFSNFADSISVKLGSGLRGTKMFDTNAEREDEEFAKLTFTSGWTAVGGFNPWKRSDVNVKIERMEQNGVEIPHEGGFGGCDLNDNSWAQEIDGVTGANSLYVNPPGATDANTHTYEAWYKVEKNRTVKSVGGSSELDETEKVAVDLLASLVYGRTQEKVINSYINKSADGQAFADAMLEFTRQPIEVWEMSTTLSLALDIDLMDEFDLIRANDELLNLRTLGTLSAYNPGQLKLWGWRFHDGIPA